MLASGYAREPEFAWHLVGVLTKRLGIIPIKPTIIPIILTIRITRTIPKNSN